MGKSTHAPDGYIWSQTMFAFGCQRKDIVTKSFIGGIMEPAVGSTFYCTFYCTFMAGL